MNLQEKFLFDEILNEILHLERYCKESLDTLYSQVKILEDSYNKTCAKEKKK